MLSQILFLLFGSILLLGSGLGIVWLLGPLRRALTPIERIPVALLFSSGIIGASSLVGNGIGLEIGAWSIAAVAISLLLLVAGLIARARSRGEARAAAEPSSYKRIALALALVSFLLMLRDGGSLGPVHDSLDFVSFVQETLQTGDLSPRSAIYRVAPDAPPDPRRGSFHTEVAAICRLSGTSPTEGWRWLPRLLAPLAILGLCAMFRPWLGARTACVAAAIFIAATFFNRDRFIQNIGYASRFGWVCGWAALLLMGRGLSLISRGTRAAASNDSSGGRALLAAGALAPILVLPVHLLSGFQVLLAMGCTTLAVWLDRAGDRRSRMAVLLMTAAGGALFLPLAAMRAAGSAEVLNPVFDHLYGVLLLAPGWPVLSPAFLTERFGILGTIGTALGLLLIPLARRSREAAFLALSTLVPLLVLFFPPIVKLVLAAHAQSVLYRVILTIPFAGTLAWILVRSLSAVARGAGWTRRIGAALLLGLIALSLILQAGATRSAWAIPERRRGDFRESAPLARSLEFLQARFPSVQTILSDPVSSYSIPAYTRHDAVAPYHQHSSPSDASALQRMRDAEEALNAHVGIERTFGVLRRYGVDLILLNQSFPRFLSSYQVFISPLVYGEQRAKFDRSPSLFETIYDAEGVVVYRVRHPDPGEALPGEPPNPYRVEDPGGEPILGCGPDLLLRFEARPGPHPAGEQIPFDMVWRRGDAPYRLPIVCEIKLQAVERPAGFSTPLLGRIIRGIVEWREGVRLRFGALFHPLVTFYPDFLWGAGETYRDELWLSVPPNARHGRYEIYFRMSEQPHARITRLSEILGNELGPEWRRMGEVVIGNRPAD